MSALIRLVAGSAFAWSAFVGSPGAAAAPVPMPAAADCMIRFDVANSFSEHRLHVLLYVERPAPAGMRWVWHTDDGTDRWLEPGESRAWYQTLPGQCGARRQYMFILNTLTVGSGEEGDDLVFSVPSGGWSTRTEVQLGDLARFFPGLEDDAPSEPEPTPPVALPAPAPAPVPLPLPAPEPEPPPGPEVYCPIRFPVSSTLQEHIVRVALSVLRQGGAQVMWGPPSSESTRWLYPGQQTVWVDTVPGECDEPRRYSFVFWADRDGVAQETVSYDFPSYNGLYSGTEVPLGDLARHFPGLEGVVTPAPPEPTEPEPAPAPTPTPAPTPAPIPAPAPPAEPGTFPGAAALTEDFSGVPEGGFPDYFEHLGGNAQVGSVDGRPALVVGSGSWFRVPLGGDLGERFTIEFDYSAPARFSFLYIAPFDAATASGRPGVPNYRAIPFHHFVITPETSGVGVSGGMPGMARAASMNAAYGYGMVPIRLVVEGEAAAVFVDGEQVARLPRAEIPRTDVLEFYYHGTRGPGHIANLRVTSE